MTRLILFLIRLKLGVKTFEFFQFDNQKSPTTVYFFDDYVLVRLDETGTHLANVSLNWLLHDDCKITKVEGFIT